MSLLSQNANKICEYLPSVDKCLAFITVYPDGTITNCSHLKHPVRKMAAKCSSCTIVNWCGGGCLGEEKDAQFCDARHHLKNYIERIFQ